MRIWVMLDDLKNYQAHSGFQLFTEEETGAIIAALLVLAFFLDRVGAFA